MRSFAGTARKKNDRGRRARAVSSMYTMLMICVLSTIILPPCIAYVRIYMLPLRSASCTLVYNSNLLVKFITISRASARATASVRSPATAPHAATAAPATTAGCRMIACGGLRWRLRRAVFGSACGGHLRRASLHLRRHLRRAVLDGPCGWRSPAEPAAGRLAYVPYGGGR